MADPRTLHMAYRRRELFILAAEVHASKALGDVHLLLALLGLHRLVASVGVRVSARELRRFDLALKHGPRVFIPHIASIGLAPFWAL